METILAVDLGIKTGMALFSGSGNLLWFRSHNFGNRTRLRKGIYTILSNITTQVELQFLVVEGSKNIGKLWSKICEKFYIPVYFVSPEVWRNNVFNIERQLTSHDAKKQAIKMALKVIKKSGLPIPKDINHNAAEAILIGLWGINKYKKEADLGEKLFNR